MLSSIFESFLRNTIVNLRNAVTLEFYLELIAKHDLALLSNTKVTNAGNLRKIMFIPNSAINLMLVSYTRYSR